MSPRKRSYYEKGPLGKLWNKLFPAEEIIEALQHGRIKSGFGFNSLEDSLVDISKTDEISEYSGEG